MRFITTGNTYKESLFTVIFYPFHLSSYRPVYLRMLTHSIEQ